MEGESPKHAGLKDKAIEELKVYWIIVLYLAVFLGAFTTYRRLVLAEFGVTYLHYGFALIQALVIAKVILVARIFGVGKRFEDGPLILSVLYKSILFGVVVLLFGIVERLVQGLFHKSGFTGVAHGIAELGLDEIVARVLIDDRRLHSVLRVLGDRARPGLPQSRRPLLFETGDILLIEGSAMINDG